MWSVALGAVRLTELFGTSRSMSSKQLKLMRGYVSEALTEGLPARIAGAPRAALGSSGTISAVVAYAATEGIGPRHRPADLPGRGGPGRRCHRPSGESGSTLAARGDRLRRGGHPRAAGQAPGARIGDRRPAGPARGHPGRPHPPQGRRQTTTASHEAALLIGRRFHFDEAHAVQVTRLGAPALRRPRAARTSCRRRRARCSRWPRCSTTWATRSATQRHHRHSYYLIRTPRSPGCATASASSSRASRATTDAARPTRATRGWTGSGPARYGWCGSWPRSSGWRTRSTAAIARASSGSRPGCCPAPSW